MAKPYKILLVIAVLLTACMLYMDALLIWGVLCGFYFLFGKIAALVTGAFRKQ